MHDYTDWADEFIEKVARGYGELGVYQLELAEKLEEAYKNGLLAGARQAMPLIQIMKGGG